MSSVWLGSAECLMAKWIIIWSIKWNLICTYSFEIQSNLWDIFSHLIWLIVVSKLELTFYSFLPFYINFYDPSTSCSADPHHPHNDFYLTDKKEWKIVWIVKFSSANFYETFMSFIFTSLSITASTTKKLFIAASTKSESIVGWWAWKYSDNIK